MNRTLATLALLTLGLAGCTGGQTSSIPSTAVNPVATGTLQLAMGTANINGVTGTNIVATLRQPSGASILATYPTLSGPFAFTAPAAAAGTSGGTWPNHGPSAAEIAGGFIGSTSPATTVPPNQAGAAIPASALTTFGLFGGLSATGFFQSNSTTSGVISATTANVAGPSIIPYPVPLYGASAGPLAVQFTPWIGPPVFAGNYGIGSRDGTYVNGLTGAAAGLNVLDGVTPGAGTYTMNVSIPLGFDSNNNPVYGALTKTAALASAATCIGGCGVPIPAPVIVAGGGGATVTVAALPSGATGALLMLRDIGPVGGVPGATASIGNVNCYPGSNTATGTVPNNSEFFLYPTVYTISITAPGTYTLPANLGPHPANSGTTTPSICTAAQNTAAAGAASPGDSVTVQMIAYNYGFLGLVPALSSSAAPPITAGDNDIGISAKATAVSP